MPALMTMYTDHLPTTTPPTTLRLALLSGDWIPLTLPTKLHTTHPHTHTISLGGATEAAIWSIHHPIPHTEPPTPDPTWTSIPYGTPLANQQTHTLNTQLHPTPIHTTGHLYISGTGLATNYHNDPTKTQHHFITNPHTGQRLYNTGDLARRHPDGTLEFLGRTDNQVKINGHRIELGEIEATLSACPQVNECAVMTVGRSPEDLVVAAFVVPRSRYDIVAADAKLTRVERPLPSAASDMEHWIELPPGEANAENEFLWRRSWRRYDPSPLALGQLAALLDAISPRQSRG